MEDGRVGGVGWGWVGVRVVVGGGRVGVVMWV